jgi:hypothetical protein
VKNYFIRIRIVASLIVLIVTPFLPYTQAFGLNAATLLDYGVTLYDPNFNECNSTDTTGTTTTNSGAASVKIVASDTLKQIFSLLITGGMNAGQASAVMGNMYRESGFNSDIHEHGNDIGYGLVQWSFGRRTKLEAYATAQGKPASDIPTQIAYLFIEYNGSYKASLAKTDFAAGTDVPKSTEAWMRIFEAPGMTPANDPAGINERTAAAIQVFALYKDLAPALAVGAVSIASCGNGNGVVAGNLVETAIGLALTTPASTGMVSQKDARDTFQTAKLKYNPSPSWSDCGGFIATAMIASGTDVNYPSVGVTGQLAYVKAHPEKYQIITGINNAGDLQPGDILYVLNDAHAHTTMYTGKSDYPSVDASLDERVPSVRDAGSAAWMLGQNATIARIIK